MQPKRFKHLVAILVLFDPRSDPRSVVSRLADLVGAVVVVDNALRAHPMIALLPSRSDVQALRNGNRGGLAGAYNAALDLLESTAPAWTHAVFVDDDSDPSVLAAFLTDASTETALADQGTAAVAPVYRERATGLRGACMQLGRFSFHVLAREQKGLVPVAFLINSMSVWRRAALRAIGPFNEGLAVDRVDTEYCLRAQRAGLKLFINGDHEFAHSIGRRRPYRLFGVTLQSGGHGPDRRFMIARNTVWLAREYALSHPVLLLLSCLWIGYEVSAVVFVEQGKRDKLWALLKGVGHGLFVRLPNPVHHQV